MSAASEVVVSGSVIYPNETHELSTEQQPVAARVEKVLAARGVIVSCEERIARHNEYAMGAGDVASQWYQFCIYRSVDAEALADRIAKLGNDVVFGELRLPPREICVSRQKSGGGVIVRHVVFYQIASDTITERYDVIVRKR